MTPPRSPTGKQEVNARLIAYRNALKKMAETIPDVITGPDLYAALDPARDFEDYVHPNNRGHKNSPTR
jgi:hypothetical protein